MSRPRWWRLLGPPALLLVLYFVVPVSADPVGGLAVRTAGALLVLGALAAGLGRVLVRQVRGGGVGGGEALVAAIALVLVVFALGYHLLELHRPGQLVGIGTRLDALYFSATTMLTIGYGDAYAAGQVARALVLAQMLFDVVYVAVAARLLTTRLAPPR